MSPVSQIVNPPEIGRFTFPPLHQMAGSSSEPANFWPVQALNPPLSGRFGACAPLSFCSVSYPTTHETTAPLGLTTKGMRECGRAAA